MTDGYSPAARYSRVGKMRHHLRELRINAMRSDGTYADTVRIQIMRAFRVLPAEVGLEWETAPGKVTVDD